MKFKINPLEPEKLEEYQQTAKKSVRPLFTCETCKKKTKTHHGGRKISCHDCWYEINPNYDEEWVGANWNIIANK